MLKRVAESLKYMDNLQQRGIDPNLHLSLSWLFPVALLALNPISI